LKIINRILVLISLFLLSSNFMLYSCIEDYPFKGIARILALAILFITIINNKEIKIPLKLYFLIVYFAIGLILGSELHANCLVITLLAYSIILNFDKKDILKCFLIVGFATIAFYLILLLTHNIENVSRTYLGRTRNFLGFNHPNGPSVIFLPMLMFIVLKAKKYKKLMSVLSIALVLVLTILTDSRTLFFTILIFSLLYILNNSYFFKTFFRELNNNRLFHLITLTLLFLSPFIIFVSSQVFPIVNEVLSKRGEFMTDYIALQPFYCAIFGFSNINDFVIDNSYLLGFFAFGIIGYIYLFKVIFKTLVSNSIEANIFMYSLLFYGVVESLLFRPECLATILFWYFVYNNYFKSSFCLESESITNKCFETK